MAFAKAREGIFIFRCSEIENRKNTWEFKRLHCERTVSFFNLLGRKSMNRKNRFEIFIYTQYGAPFFYPEKKM